MQPKPKGFFLKEKEFWNELRDYIHRNEAHVTSEPHTAVVRFECLPQSSLPQLLDAGGFDIVGGVTGERLWPSVITETRGSQTFVNSQVVPTVVCVYQFALFD
jgi:hypothetical protein